MSQTSGASGSAANVTTTQPPVAEKVSPVEFVIEFGDEFNGNFRWAPGFDDRTLRGAWKRVNVPRGDPAGAMADMPDIPGLRLMLSSQRAHSEIRDPLLTEQHGKLKDKIRAVYKQTMKEDGRPEDPVIYRNLGENEIKTICWLVRRMLDARQVTVLSGSVPEVDTIRRMPGQIMTGTFDMGPEGRKLGDIPARYVPMTHPTEV